MKWKCIIIDDDEIQLNYLKYLLENLEEVESVLCFLYPIEALKLLKHGSDIDIAFVDISMPIISGIELAGILSFIPYKIVVSQYEVYALNAFEVGYFDYLTKPVAMERLETVFVKIRSIEESNRTRIAQVDKSKEFIFVKSHSKLIKILLNDILYVEAVNNYIAIQLKEGSSYIHHITLKDFLQSKLNVNFMRVHKSFVICLSCITAIGEKHIELGSVIIPIGPTFQSKVRSLI